MLCTAPPRGGAGQALEAQLLAEKIGRFPTDTILMLASGRGASGTSHTLLQHEGFTDISQALFWTFRSGLQIAPQCRNKGLGHEWDMSRIWIGHESDINWICVGHEWYMNWIWGGT